MKTLLVIAGTDSSGGAGLTRDTATATTLGLQVKPVVTAVTAQSDGALHHCHPVPVAAIQTQFTAAFRDRPPDAVKIGMLATDDIVDAVADMLTYHPLPVVLDPVLKSSSGGVLLAGDGLRPLFPLVSLLTPNLDESAALTGRPFAETTSEIRHQAARLRASGASAVLIKGGHGTGSTCTDHLFRSTGHTAISAPRLPQTRRGTGCALATAIACYLAQGRTLDHACRLARRHVQVWLAGDGPNRTRPRRGLC